MRKSLSIGNGFTLLELIIVIAGLGILASLAIPNFLKYLDYAKNDEAAAFMNALASECLQNYRENTSSLDEPPKLLERSGPPKDFKIENDFNKCSSIFISPIDNNSNLFASIGFAIKLRNETPYIYKFGSYTHPDAEPACKNWASYKEDNNGVTIKPLVRACIEGGDVEAIRTKNAAEAAERERLRLIKAAFDKWFNGPPPGAGYYGEDGYDVWAFQGREYADETAYKDAVKRQCGRELNDALEKAEDDKFDGPWSYTSDKGGCSINTYLCKGKNVQTKDGYDNCKAEQRTIACSAELNRRKTSPYTNGLFEKLTDGTGCTATYICNGSEGSKDWYEKDSACKAPIDNPKKTCRRPDPDPWYCINNGTFPECQPICTTS